jgi:hypothetical protein
MFCSWNELEFRGMASSSLTEIMSFEAFFMRFSRPSTYSNLSIFKLNAFLNLSVSYTLILSPFKLLFPNNSPNFSLTYSNSPVNYPFKAIYFSSALISLLLL